MESGLPVTHHSRISLLSVLIKDHNVVVLCYHMTDPVIFLSVGSYKNYVSMSKSMSVPSLIICTIPAVWASLSVGTPIPYLYDTIR